MPLLSAFGCRPGATRLAFLSLAVLLAGAGERLAAASLDLPLADDEVSLRAGASVRLTLSSAALGWLSPAFPGFEP